jgi:hypothetical protein
VEGHHVPVFAIGPEVAVSAARRVELQRFLRLQRIGEAEAALSILLAPVISSPVHLLLRDQVIQLLQQAVCGPHGLAAVAKLARDHGGDL